ncbi:MAG: deoxyribose-phosphate aldolase [Cyclobacteriaceae bacterium]|nr:deoxyribose-phosphate aldolase [Cyclobacteriaceae bacterium]MCH8515189.1 deoxyribose-phosphate aldolase [Cyclobacteriaceae bacterium]
MIAIKDYLEHTALKPTLVDDDIEKLASEAKTYDMFGICVPPFWVKKAARILKGSDVSLVTVVGFPLGYQMTETKIEETKLALKDGADEIDWVWNISAFKAGMNWPKIELAKASSLIHSHEKLLKVIIETAYLSEKEIVEACKICVDAGVDIVKTSTGFAGAGAQVKHIELMRAQLPKDVGIKASGGIKSYADAMAMIDAGADRIGTSSGVEIIKGQK